MAERRGDGREIVRRWRVLLADDDPHIREFVQVALEIDGRFAVVGSTDRGDEAVQLLADEQPDLALLDLGLPDLDAADLFEQGHRAAPDCRLLAFTGSGGATTELFVQAVGGAGVIVKGTRTMQELVADLVDHLDVIDLSDERRQSRAWGDNRPLTTSSATWMRRRL